jgi:type II secretory pathway pseudopilin PulG
MKMQHAQSGAVLMGLMVLLALVGVAMGQAAESLSTTQRRERESQLLWVGQQYKAALESYYLATPGPAKHLPVKLEELVRDSRFPQPVRHLRRLYADPFQPAQPWGLVRRGNQIVGVYSTAEGEPLRRRSLGVGLEALDNAALYADWRFVFLPRQGMAPGPSAAPAPSNKSEKP